jgi:uncharacterized membrane protein
MRVGYLPLIFFLILLALLPLVFGQLFTTALMKLRLESSTAIRPCRGSAGSPHRRRSHLRDIEALETGIACIGGTGTFDGIVLSGFVATYLA